MAYHTFNLFKDELNKSKINQALPSYNDFKLARYMLKFVQSKPQIFKQTICEIINKSTYPQSRLCFQASCTMGILEML